MPLIPLRRNTGRSSIRCGCGGAGSDLLGGSKSWVETGGCSNEVRAGCKHRVIGKVASNTGSRDRKASCQTGQYISVQLIGPSLPSEKKRKEERKK